MEKELEEKTQELLAGKEAVEKKYAAELEAKEEAEKKYAEQAERIAVLEAKEKDAEIKLYVADLEKEELVTPAMKPLIEALVGETKKEYSITTSKKDEETVEKKFSDKKEILKETLKLCSEASKVNLEENSNDVEIEKGDEQDLLNAKIEKYATEHKVSYVNAYKVIMKNSNNEGDE